MAWIITYHPKVREDLRKLDHTQAAQVMKAISKVSINPLPTTEGGYGKPLSNHNETKLVGLCKIKLKHAGLRVVYALKRDDHEMQLIVISIRDDSKVYKIAHKRFNES